MQFLKILFGCLLAFVAAVFTVGNWTNVPLRLPGDLVAETNLPLLLLLVFLVGFVPTLLYQHLQRWRLRQRLASAQRQLTELRALSPAPAAPTDPLVHAGLDATGMPDVVPIARPPVAADSDSATGSERLL